MKKNVANPVSYIQDNLSKETSCDHMRQSSNSVVIGWIRWFTESCNKTLIKEHFNVVIFKSAEIKLHWYTTSTY